MTNFAAFKLLAGETISDPLPGSIADSRVRRLI